MTGTGNEETRHSSYTNSLVACKAKMSSSSSTSVTDLVASFLRIIETTIRQICRRINEQGVIALLKAVVLFAALFGVKENLKHTFGYKCPQQGHFFYGNLYIFGPSVFFLCFALVFSRPFWEFVTGCCRCSLNMRRLLASPSSAVDIYLAFSAPFLWVACGLSEEDYYICALYGPVSHSELQKEWFEVDREARRISKAKTACHYLVWEIIISWSLISTVVVSLHRCCTRKPKTNQIQSV